MRYFLSLIFSVLLCNQACIYSFKGGSVPPHLKTVAIPLFDDQSGAGEPRLREKFTNRLIEKFRQDNTLEITNKTQADLIIEGILTSMKDDPLVVESGSTVSKWRVTLTVKVINKDKKLGKTILEKQYSNWGDYAKGADPAQRQIGIDAAIEKLTEDILLDTVAKW